MRNRFYWMKGLNDWKDRHLKMDFVESRTDVKFCSKGNFHWIKNILYTVSCFRMISSHCWKHWKMFSLRLDKRSVCIRHKYLVMIINAYFSNYRSTWMNIIRLLLPLNVNINNKIQQIYLFIKAPKQSVGYCIWQR